MPPREEHLRAFGVIVGRLMRGESITRAEARECWRQICEEEQSDLHQGAFIAALRAKGETPEELAGTFDALYEYDTIRVTVDTPEPLIDNCGTGADALKTLNISTGAAIVAAACGLYVVRHAARAVSSHCGAIDVIEALGIDVESAPDLPKQSIERAGICAWNGFLRSIHPKTVARVISQIRFGSSINLVGPLLNPTMPSYKVMGVGSGDMIDLETQILKELNFKRAFVMHGLEEGTGRGMDELSTLGLTHVAELFPDGHTERYAVQPEDLGLRRGRLEDLASSRNVQSDALALLRVLVGIDAGPRSDIICLNAAPLLYITGKARDLRHGIDMAREAVGSGSALAKLRDWVTWQNAEPGAGLPILERMLQNARWAHGSRPEGPR
jgi:anthranilate phosphoribosyltransferase